MTLGRTSSGAIKVKTDGGLRAVECACCGGCGCGITMSASAQSALEGVTSGTLWGFPSIYWEPLDNGGWYMYWDYLGSEDEPGMEFSLNYNPPCLYGSGYYFENTETDLAKEVYIVSSPNVQGIDCIAPNFTTATGTFTINGIGPFTYYFITGDTSLPELQFGPPPVPNLSVS